MRDQAVKLVDGILQTACRKHRLLAGLDPPRSLRDLVSDFVRDHDRAMLIGMDQISRIHAHPENFYWDIKILQVRVTVRHLHA